MRLSAWVWRSSDVGHELGHEPAPFCNSRTKDEREGRGRFEGPRCGAFVLVLVRRPSMATKRTPTYVPGGMHGARFMVPIHVRFWKKLLPMHRLHFAIRGRRTSARDEDDLKDPVAALSSSSSSVVRRWRRSAHRPMYLAGCTELGSWSQFMSLFGKYSYPCTDCPVGPASLPAGVGPLDRLAGRMPALPGKQQSSPHLTHPARRATFDRESGTHRGWLQG